MAVYLSFPNQCHLPIKDLVVSSLLIFFSCGLSLTNLHGMVENILFYSEFGLILQRVQGSGLTGGCLLACAITAAWCKHRHKPGQEMEYDTNYRKQRSEITFGRNRNKQSITELRGKLSGTQLFLCSHTAAKPLSSVGFLGITTIQIIIIKK